MMKEAEEMIGKINNWADATERSVFCVARDGDGQYTSVNASERELANMLIGAMDENESIAGAVTRAAVAFLTDRAASKDQ